ncbi:MAG: hypothetical protein Q9174_002856 [Haloplaca sp. 1 TL-2023]
MQDFENKVQAYLKPFSFAKADFLTEFAVQSEERYREVLSHFRDTKDRLRCFHALDALNFEVQFGSEAPMDPLWKINFLARCTLLQVTFTDNGRLAMGLVTWHTAAGQLKKSKNGAEGKLDELICVCGEMNRRMSAEMPRDRFQETEVVNGNEIVWTVRMTAQWLRATEASA